MKISGWDLRAAFRQVTNIDYLDLDVKKEGLSEKQYFDKMWDSVREFFSIYSASGDFLRIGCKSDKITTLIFLRQFIILNTEIDLKFNINYECGTIMLIIPQSCIDNEKLISIMALLYWQVCHVREVLQATF